MNMEPKQANSLNKHTKHEHQDHCALPCILFLVKNHFFPDEQRGTRRVFVRTVVSLAFKHMEVTSDIAGYARRKIELYFLLVVLFALPRKTAPEE